jgi:hypothetical protein
VNEERPFGGHLRREGEEALHLGMSAASVDEEIS